MPVSRVYIAGAAESVPISPTPRVQWDAAYYNFYRCNYRTAHGASPLTTYSWVDDGPNSDQHSILFVQVISDVLTPGQVIVGGGTVGMIALVSETNLFNNMAFYGVAYILAADGVTVHKSTGFAQSIEAKTDLRARLINNLWNAGNYTTVNGDRFIMEWGLIGTPAASHVHDCSIRLGNNAASDILTEDSTDDLNPFCEHSNVFTFGTPTYILGNTSILGKASML